MASPQENSFENGSCLHPHTKHIAHVLLYTVIAGGHSLLLHPLMMDTKADTELGFCLTGVMSAYVSSSDSCTFMAAAPSASPACGWDKHSRHVVAAAAVSRNRAGVGY
jgi:hypothetical protein